MKHTELKIEMLKHDIMLCDLAKELKVTYPTLSKKIEGKNTFTAREIAVISKKFKFSPERIVEVFLSEWLD